MFGLSIKDCDILCAAVTAAAFTINKDAMMTMFDEKEFLRWFKQAEHNLESAKRDAAEGDYDWACFKAQQAAEIAIKAFITCMGKIIKSHSTVDLLAVIAGFGVNVPEKIMKCARKLDKFYIPTRYPDAIGLGSPYESYDAEEFKVALKCSEQILALVKKEIKNAKNH